MQKKKRMEHVSFVLAVDGILVFIFTFKETFLLSYFSVTKSTKSQQREHSPLFANSLRVHEFVAQVMRGKRVRQRGKAKIGGFALSAISYYHACEHITRKSRVDSCTHWLHARDKCKAGVGLVPALTG